MMREMKMCDTCRPNGHGLYSIVNHIVLLNNNNVQEEEQENF